MKYKQEIERLEGQVAVLTEERDELKLRVEELERGPVITLTEESERKFRVKEHQSKLRGGIE